MSIMLGNLSVDEIEKRLGVKFDEPFRSGLLSTRQEKASSIEKGKWHCFDIPFMLACGDMKTAKKIYDNLKPLSSSMKCKLQIGIDTKK